MATIDELLFRNPRDRMRPDALIMSGSEVLQAPPIAASPGMIPGAITQDQYEDEAARRARYQDEVESAERLRRQQAIQGLIESGLRPPAALSAPATPPPPILRTLGNQIYSFDRSTGEPNLAVQGAARQPQRQRGYTQAEVDAYGPLEQGYEWSPSAYPGFFEPVRKRAVSQSEAIGKLISGESDGLTPPTQSGTTAPQPAPPLTSRKKNTIYQTPKGPMRWTGTGWVTP